MSHAGGRPATGLAGAVVTRRRLRVSGIVQGVGFRPFVHGLAQRLGLGGFVANDAEGVLVEVEGSPEAVDDFVDALSTRPPPLAVIESVDIEVVAPIGERAFAIAASEPGGRRRTVVPADTATCPDCLAELWDPTDRRHRYPFTNCTGCGPRFTIVRDIPYDRPNTTMAAFPMCADCAREYHDPTDRRYHAQPTCCPACGPQLRLLDARGTSVDGDALVGVVAALEAGQVVAVKGLGGYHLAALAEDTDAVATLRRRKHREDKPFAVMVADLSTARSLCVVGEAAAELLAGPQRPIVLLPRREGGSLAAAVAPGNRFLGLMLPYTPLHHLVARDLRRPFVLTSGNVSDEPIAYRDDEALERLAGIADAFCVHDRPIETRTDDSVVRVVAGAGQSVRRSRGFVPQPLRLPVAARRPVLACGAELKHTFCLARDHQAVVSHHIGDLENYETHRAFTDGVAHLRRLLDVEPAVVAHDLHPEYLSTKYALDLDGVDHVGVQHHHAHVASCLADNGEPGPVIGVAFDGLGYGTDGTLWGGELLVADLAGFDRAGHLRLVPMPGGAAAIREPWRMAAAWLDAAFFGEPPGDLDVIRRNAARWDAVLSMARAGTHAPLTSSMGRLFDAVASLLGVRDAVTYEGQAAIELEQLADPGEAGAYPVPWEDGAPGQLDAATLVRAVVADLRARVDAATIAARFHNGLADGVVATCRVLRDRTGLTTVALSGGVFQNVLLVERVTAGLAAAGVRVLLHRHVPPNDGGISLGQAAVAAARDAAG